MHPCNIPDENGNYKCPYAQDYMGSESEICRNMCGLGVDEDYYALEENYK